MIDEQTHSRWALKAAEFATGAHRGQKRDDGEPYIQHPIRVAEKFSTTHHKAIAYLHDVVEDSPVMRRQLEQIFPDTVVEAVMLLTREKGESYFDFIMKLIRSNNVAAMSVKMGDLEDNLRDTKEGSRADKYRLAHFLLRQKLGEWSELWYMTDGDEVANFGRSLSEVKMQPVANIT